MGKRDFARREALTTNVIRNSQRELQPGHTLRSDGWSVRRTHGLLFVPPGTVLGNNFTQASEMRELLSSFVYKLQHSVQFRI